MGRDAAPWVERLRALVRSLLATAAVAAAVAAACGVAAGASYRVRPGDTLSGIATRYHTTVVGLARLNKLDADAILPIGLTLRVPAQPVRLTAYVVRPGDTLSDIAYRHGLTVAGIARVNRLDPEDLLVAGRRLMLPAGPSRETIRDTIRRWADHYRIPRSLALALAWQESGYQPRAESESGAVGVMQVMPDTWTYVESVLIRRRIPRTPSGNVQVGLAYLRHLLDEFGNTQLALASYLQGEQSVRTEGIHRSTRQYIANVLALAHRIAQ
ncbi:MAG TPA: LysM peptidoglycan-binding domain-containing protein [Gaiellaceae bacterium]|nr:LysM peptidoglycan-binding domain-containing protein [Gaiellaceae bacterium]